MDQFKEDVLLLSLPFVTPLVPPMGISLLKSLLIEAGFKAKCSYSMEDIDIKRLCYYYFDELESFLPEKRRGFYFNIAFDVFYNHMMGHINKTDESLYCDLVNDLVYNNFYTGINKNQISKLIAIIEDLYDAIEKYIKVLIENNYPKYIGFSLTKGNLASVTFVGRMIKKLYPEIKMFIGGTSFSSELMPGHENFDRYFKKESFCEAIFVGEADYLIIAYLKGELPEKKVYSRHDIGGEMVKLDKLPFINLDDFDYSNYLVLTTYTSRGCIYNCTFCGEREHWYKYHCRSPKRIVDEMDSLSEKHNRKNFLLTDSLINPIIDQFSDELIKRKANYYWDVYQKIDDSVCNPEKVMKWRKAGFYRARLGVETGSEELLKAMNKKLTIEKIKKGLSTMARAGIKTTTYWLNGHPGETDEDFKKTLLFLEELQDFIYEVECDPFRYFHTGQVNAGSWAEEMGVRSLYGEKYTDMLVTQTYVLENSIPHELILERNFLFKEKCKSLGIPNPYSVSDIKAADERWRALHKNAVPPLLELSKNFDKFKDDKLNIEILSEVETDIEDLDFAF